MTTLSFFNLGAITLSFASIVTVCTEPLIRVANKFNFYLFTDNNFFKYIPNELHKHSQNLFISAAFFIGLAMFFSLIDTIAEIAEKEDSANIIKGLTLSNLCIGTVLYISGVSTLGRVVYDVIDKIEHLPLPNPIKDVDIVYKIGSKMGTIGLIASLLGICLSSIAIHHASFKRRSYVHLP